MTITPSTFLSFNTLLSADSYLSCRASPIISIGLLKFAVFGRYFFNSVMVFSSNLASSNPYLILASVAIIPGPPALVTIAILLPLGIGEFANAIAFSKSSSTVSTRRTPLWTNNALYSSSEPASAPV